MKVKKDLAVGYYIDNSKRLESENHHISDAVISAYEAGFEKAREMAARIAWDEARDGTTHAGNYIQQLGEDEIPVETITLSEQDFALFLEVLDNPPEANEKLKKAFAEYKKRVKQ